jgi:hypothetical protein
LADIQEVRVNQENFIPFKNKATGKIPNPYNPEDYDIFDGRLKRQIKNDMRLSQEKINLMRQQDGRCIICNEVLV